MPLLKAPEGGVIALGGEWNASPRRARLTSTDQPVYIKAVAEFLEARGLKEPKVNITQIIRVDLDGGGKEDVLISGTNYFSKEGRLSRTIAVNERLRLSDGPKGPRLEILKMRRLPNDQRAEIRLRRRVSVIAC